MSTGGALGVLGGALINPDAAGPRPLTVDDMMPIFADIAYRFSVIADALDNADQQARSSVTAATDAATQAEVIGQDVKDITEHTYTIVIPHSLSWLSGYLVSHFIVQLQQAVAKLNGEVENLTTNVNILRAWRTNYVDPNVEKWVGFKKWFDGWPSGILYTWHDWFEHPDKFAQWAAAPLIGPLVSYLAAPEHKQARDNLMAIIADAWTDQSGDVLDDFFSMLLADT